ncbi:hypothetical protein C1646_765158 [Rhizophagus diaphanus]|nr:hypothetical protein C1646_765158 [Rhizophagus diaphanus] [Rhizophagus sp. MUCL 43196]
MRLNAEYEYCGLCNSQHFKQNFINWTSGNHEVDEFIQKAQLKAKNENQIIEWNQKCTRTEVALKCLHNSQDITAEFLKEVESNILVYNLGWVVRCFGISKDTKTNDFMMVMDFKDDSLRQYLNNNFISRKWEKKLFHLQVLPYVAPEALRGNEYTQKTHDEFLEMKICKGLGPTSNYKIPQLNFDIINQLDSVIYGQVKEADGINKKSSFPIQLPLSHLFVLFYEKDDETAFFS